MSGLNEKFLKYLPKENFKSLAPTLLVNYYALLSVR